MTLGKWLYIAIIKTFSEEAARVQGDAAGKVLRRESRGPTLSLAAGWRACHYWQGSIWSWSQRWQSPVRRAELGVERSGGKGRNLLVRGMRGCSLPGADPSSGPIRLCGWTVTHSPVLPLPSGHCIGALFAEFSVPPGASLSHSVQPFLGLSPQATPPNKRPVSLGGQVLPRQDCSPACQGALGRQTSEQQPGPGQVGGRAGRFFVDIFGFEPLSLGRGQGGKPGLRPES